MSDAIRLQPVVPAGNGRGEAVSAIVEPAVPAGTDCGASAAVESPQRLEALVAALRERLAEVERLKAVAAYTGHYYRADGWHCYGAGLEFALQLMASAATGGND